MLLTTAAVSNNAYTRPAAACPPVAILCTMLCSVGVSPYAVISMPSARAHNPRPVSSPFHGARIKELVEPASFYKLCCELRLT